MLFNSLPFLLIYLPITLTLFFIIGKNNAVGARSFLAVASLAFYGYWDWRFLPLLLSSILINFTFGAEINRCHTINLSLRAKRVLITGIGFNLLLLIFFKYTNLLISSYEAASHTEIDFPRIVLPIGISFFTFTQLAYLVDCYQKKVTSYRFWDYALFVSYFPHQIAGPILHHKEMLAQFGDTWSKKFDIQNLTVGFSVLIFGLAKKILLADPLSTIASPTFLSAANGVSPTFLESWVAAIAYAFQLYLDFSAYCDMALGISLMFGIRLPLNFNSPYKSLSIIEFWRRWHMTLSRFLRDYLYIPLGGNRFGSYRRYINLFITMCLGGLWHGASWTFLLWGALHGLYLTINHLWRDLSAKSNCSFMQSKLYICLSWLLTFVAVLVGWVFFRSDSFSSAILLLKAMSGFNGIYVPPVLHFLTNVSNLFVSDAGWSGSIGGYKSILFVLIVGISLLLLPNTQEVFAKYRPCLDEVENKGSYSWTPSLSWALLLSILLALSLSRLGNDSSFLYFNF